MKRVCCFVLAALCTLGAARAQGTSQPEGVRAVVSGVAALTIAAVLTAVRSSTTGSFTLAGRAIPFTLASAGIFAALQWGLNQARIAAGSSLGVWNDWDDRGVCYQGTAGVVPSADYVSVNWCRSDLPGGTSQFSFFTINDGATILFTADACAGVSWIAASGIPTVDYSTTRIARSSLNAAFSYFTANCLGAGTSKPSLADWIAGTYTPQAGQTAIAHPEAAEQLRGLLQQKIVSDNPQSSDEAASSGIGIYPALSPIEWFIGQPSCAGGSIFDSTVKACVNITCEAGQLINPATSACGVPPVCSAGFRRVGSSWVCTANPSCPAGSSFDISTSQCRPDEAACINGQVRDPYTRQCRAPDGCPTGQIRDSGSGQCVAVQCPSGQILDPLTNLCSDSKPTALPVAPFDALLAKIGAAITRVVAVGSNKIPFGLASYFPSFAAGSSCDQLDVVMDLGTVLGSVTLPICSNMGVVFWHEKIRPLLLAVFSVLGAIWIIRNGLQS